MWNMITQGLLGAKSVILSWLLLPLAIWSSFATGGFGRWAKLLITKGDFLTTTGLDAYTGAATDKIHFLNTASGDAILLESNGHFGLVDCAEDSDNPKNNPDLANDGFELYVLDYVKRVAGGKLDFVLGTHAHSDHIGGFDTLILDPAVTVGKAYLKLYSGNNKHAYEKEWDNQEIYDQMIAACHTRGVPLVQENLDHLTFTLGDMKLSIFNGVQDNDADENDDSMGLLVECRGKRAFLAGDINNISGDETRLGKEIGRVDLLKAGHHGYEGSNTMGYITRMLPETVIFTNKAEWVYKAVQHRLVCIANSKLIATGSFGGVLAVFTNANLDYYSIMEYPKGLGGLG